MAKIFAESGAQLLARVSSQGRPAVSNLDTVLFPDGGPNPGNLVEIIGDSNCGKSMLLIDIIAKCILPVEYGGKDSEVILVNGESSFQILQLHRMLMKRIEATSACTGQLQLVERCLEKLHIYPCYSADEFEIALLSLESVLVSNSRIGVVAIDTISAFYWLSCKEKPAKMETQYRRNIRRLKKICMEYKVVCAFTRPSYYGTSQNFLSNEYVINLSRSGTHEESHIVGADINLCGHNFKTKFTLTETGINLNHILNLLNINFS